MRGSGVVDSADGLLPFGHLGWAYADRAEFRQRAAEYAADGIAAGQHVEYVGAADRDELHAELAELPVTGPALDAGSLAVTPVREYYEFVPGSDVVDAEAAVAKRVTAAEDAVAAGYTGSRAVVDATAVARTGEQRDAFARFEYLIDQKMATLPVSAVCAYDSAQLGPAAAELVCLHPFVGSNTTTFQLYAQPHADFALAGEIDLTDRETLATTLRRVVARRTGDALVVDATGLEFIDHRNLLELARHGGGSDAPVVLRGAPRSVIRLAGLLGLTNVHAEPAAAAREDGEAGP
jgi:anti-anti-sigma regulatory factor